jgi:catechol 2,3-dioxygenase-like lactoylglutathione lyase family enzyme
MMIPLLFSMSAWSAVTLGVADLDQALDLWVGDFGLQVVARRNGDDPELLRLWKLEAGDIARQALVGTPGESTGLIHLVEFNDPAPPVREGAKVFDRCPKNLDIYVRDLPRRHLELLAAGRRFHTEQYSELTAPNGVRFREIHMPSHDRINVVLLELMEAELPFADSGYAGVGPLVLIVDDAAKEKEFFEEIIGLDILSDNILAGPEIEQMIGLPQGAALDVSIWGKPDRPLGQIEIVEYRGVAGDNLYPRARPKSLGILHIGFAVQDMEALKSLLDRSGITWTEHGRLSTLPASGRVIHFHSPAGLRIEVFSD